MLFFWVNAKFPVLIWWDIGHMLWNLQLN